MPRILAVGSPGSGHFGCRAAKDGYPVAAGAEDFCRRGWVFRMNKGFQRAGTAFAFCCSQRLSNSRRRPEQDYTELEMPLDINSVFDTHAKSLALGSQRIELLAANIANADTPNYLARDIDFKSAMAAERSATVSIASSHAGHINPARQGRGPATVLYRNPDQPAQDGNTVDAQREKAAVAETDF